MKESNALTISVIIPAYNGSDYIEEALGSVLRQTRTATEVIVIDDGSTDQTAEIVARFGRGVKYFAKPNGGVASARNEGLRRTSGEFVAFLDQDDWWPDDMLEKAVTSFEQNPRFQVVKGLSKVVFEHESGRIGFKLPEDQLITHFVLVGSALFRRTAFEQVGLFDETLHASNDFDWFNRAREIDLPLMEIFELTLFYRRHSENASNDVPWLRTEMMKALKMSLDRRREQPPMNKISSFKTLSENND